MKSIRKVLLAAATATAVTVSGTAVASAEGSPAAETSVMASEDGGTPETPDPADKGPTGSSDFNEVFGSTVTDKETGEPTFQFAQALKALKNVAAFGTAVASVLGVVLTLSTKLPEVLELFGIQSPTNK